VLCEVGCNQLGKREHRKIVLCAEEDDNLAVSTGGFPSPCSPHLTRVRRNARSPLPQSQLACRTLGQNASPRWHNAQIGPKRNSQAYFAVRNVVWKTFPFCSAAAGASLLSALLVECGFCGQTVMHVMPQSSRPHEWHFRIQPKLSSSL
jgi:hypothetical protein